MIETPQSSAFKRLHNSLGGNQRVLLCDYLETITRVVNFSGCVPVMRQPNNEQC